MGARDTIFDNLIEKLSQISPANGYHTDVKSVVAGPVGVDAVADKFPMAVVLQGDEELNGEDDINVTFKTAAGVVLYVKGRSSSGMSNTINDFADDVKRMIYAPIDLGSHGLSVRLVAASYGISDTEGMATAGIQLEIIYYAAKATF